MAEILDTYEGLRRVYLAALERIALAESQLAALLWRPITPESLPKVGDEVTRNFKDGYWEVAAVADFLGVMAFLNFKAGEWTHYRPINPPQMNGNYVKEPQP